VSTHAGTFSHEAGVDYNKGRTLCVGEVIALWKMIPIETYFLSHVENMAWPVGWVCVAANCSGVAWRLRRTSTNILSR
jgi:hypothetical protein